MTAATEQATSDHRRPVHRMTLSAEDRRSAMDALMLRPSRRIVGQYSVLLVLSIIVATMGLLMGSTAVVIGAMMIAPLMAPIMGMSASITMGWGTRLLATTAIVGASVIGGIAVAWALARFVPLANSGLPAELLSRSSPDIRDLVVALAAGAAGSYATVRRDVSGALPGVAVAVALVPPLAAVGVLLGLDQPGLARGAALLFAANLFGIMLAASIVFIVTGFVPARQRRHSPIRFVLSIVLVTVPVAFLALLLGSRFAASVADASALRLATQTAVNWLGPDSADSLEAVTVSDSTVTVEVSGPVPPGSTSVLTSDLIAAFGRPISAAVQWFPVRNGDEPVPVPDVPLDGARPVVEAWLAERGLALTGLSSTGGTIIADTRGPEAPGEVASLADAIEDALGIRPEISISWTQSVPEAVQEPSVLDIARGAAEQWAAGIPDVAVLGVTQKADAILVTFAGGAETAPAELRVALGIALPDTDVRVNQILTEALADLGSGLAEPFPPATQTDEDILGETFPAG